MIYGYARVSTDGQSVDAQVKQLRVAGAEKVFRETASGTSNGPGGIAPGARPAGQRRCTDGDAPGPASAVHPRPLEYVGCHCRQGGRIPVPWRHMDTTTAHGRLMLTVLGGLAEFERELIRARTGEGRERAKARGVKMGRKPKLTPHQIREAVGRRDQGETVRDIARTYNVSHSTISRLATRPR
jgi:DNA invertase Pin-like site-specific DNA recombinase